MPEQPIKDKTAIVGIGWTPFTRSSGVTTMTLAAEASLKAIADAGLEVQDIDGVVSYFHKRPEVFGNDRNVPVQWLKRCSHLAGRSPSIS